MSTQDPAAAAAWAWWDGEIHAGGVAVGCQPASGPASLPGLAARLVSQQRSLNAGGGPLRPRGVSCIPLHTMQLYNLHTAGGRGSKVSNTQQQQQQHTVGTPPAPRPPGPKARSSAFKNMPVTRRASFFFFFLPRAANNFPARGAARSAAHPSALYALLYCCAGC